jgi:hypothetical protein
MTRTTMFLLAFSTLCASAAAAQRPAVVRGMVVDAGSGRPVAGAVVHVGEDHLAVADREGRFEISRLNAGPYAVWATAMGYGAGAAEIEVPFDSMTVTLSLEADPVRLEAIVATVNRFESRTRTYAHPMRVFREEQLRTAAAVDMREFVRWRAGLSRVACGMGDVCVRVRGRPARPAVYIDEVPMIAGLDLLSVLKPWEVARVEVYSGGGQIRVYTRSFMEWAARTHYRPLPLSLAY